MSKKGIRKKLLWILITIFIVLSISSVLLYKFYFNDSKENDNKNILGSSFVYNNYTFTKFDDGYWYIESGVKGIPYAIPFYYTPMEAENVLIEEGLNLNYRIIKHRMNSSTIFVTLDPNTNSTKIVAAAVEAVKILGKGYNLYNFDVITSITNQPNDRIMDYPIITCDNSSEKNMVIFLKINESANNNIRTEGKNCIIIEGKSPNDLIISADAFAYRILDVIKRK